MGDKGDVPRDYTAVFRQLRRLHQRDAHSGFAVSAANPGAEFWILVLYASCFIPPVLRVGRTPDMVVAFVFFSFAVLSVAWSNHSTDSVMKFVALLITTIGVSRLACRMSLDAIMGCTIIGLFILTVMSLVFVVFFPDVGVATGWMQEGLWQGVFEFKAEPWAERRGVDVLGLSQCTEARREDPVPRPVRLGRNMCHWLGIKRRRRAGAGCHCQLLSVAPVAALSARCWPLGRLQ